MVFKIKNITDYKITVDLSKKEKEIRKVKESMLD
jgi:hypothetical protein